MTYYTGIPVNVKRAGRRPAFIRGGVDGTAKPCFVICKRTAVDIHRTAAVERHCAALVAAVPAETAAIESCGSFIMYDCAVCIGCGIVAECATVEYTFRITITDTDRTAPVGRRIAVERAVVERQPVSSRSRVHGSSLLQTSTT